MKQTIPAEIHEAGDYVTPCVLLVMKTNKPQAKPPVEKNIDEIRKLCKRLFLKNGFIRSL
jgi:hypothetical protein